MKYIEAPKFGGPEVLRLIEAEMPKPGEGMWLVEVQVAGITVLIVPPIRLVMKTDVQSW